MRADIANGSVAWKADVRSATHEDMGHHINAIIGTATALAKIVAAAGSPAPTELAFDLAIAPLGHEQIDKLTKLEASDYAAGFRYLSPALERGLLKAADGDNFAYIETEYFGGTGYQAAAIFSSDGSVTRWAGTENHEPPVADWPINRALRALGVQATLGQDEFDTLGLGRFRDLEALGLDEWGND